jgi:DnaJ domain
MSDLNHYYELLGLKPTATAEEIKQAYRDLTKVWHPDRFTHDPRLQQKAQEKLKEINHAYDNLKNISANTTKGNEQPRPENKDARWRATGKEANRHQPYQDERVPVKEKNKIKLPYTKIIFGLLAVSCILVFWVANHKKEDSQFDSIETKTIASEPPALTVTPTVSATKKLTVTELTEPYRTVLEDFLTIHADLVFLKESEFDRKSIEWMRNEPYFGKRFSPYHRVGDFNRDGKKDFAVILKSVKNPRKDLSLADTHQERYQVSLLIFNGAAEGSFQVAYVEHGIEAPLVCFVHVPEGEKGLFFGVFETDEGMVLTLKGKGYKSESIEQYNERTGR